MEIRNADITDLEEILSIYERARAYMRETGNPNQWKNINPTSETVVADINNKDLYVICDEDLIEGVFAFIDGADPTYNYIEGAWLDELSYCAVHRVASAGRKKGIIKIIMDYAFSRSDSIKIDTHHDNKIMQHQLEKYGFKSCGIIYLENGEPRIAYQMRI